MIDTQLTRRKFLAAGGAMLGAVATGCVHGGKPIPPIVYPRLAGDKIQPPEHYGLKGAYVGTHLGHYVDFPKALEHYLTFAKRKPTFIMLPHYNMCHVPTGLSTRYLQMLDMCAASGIIPFISYNATDPNREASAGLIGAGAFDDEIRTAATHLKRYGEHHGGFFIRTMKHMNAEWYSHIHWGKTDAMGFIRAWIHIWEIFEETGTNQYATWVFPPYVPENNIGEEYYPGGQYVDWISLSGYNMDGFDVYIMGTRFHYLFNKGRRKSAYRYPGKPIMIGETGMTENRRKPKWIADAFKDMKGFPNVRAIAWDSGQWRQGGEIHMDWRLDSSPEAAKAYGNCLKDTYFLGNIPYRATTAADTSNRT